MEKEGGFAGRARSRCTCLRHGRAQCACRAIGAAGLGSGVRTGGGVSDSKGVGRDHAKDLVSCAWLWALLRRSLGATGCL